MFACKESSLYDVVVELVQKGCAVNIQDRQFNTALFHACKAQCIKIVVYLIQSGGADTSLTNEDNQQAVEYLTEDMYWDAKKAAVKGVMEPPGGYRSKPTWNKNTIGIM